jgi:hypothetical protein
VRTQYIVKYGRNGNNLRNNTTSFIASRLQTPHLKEKLLKIDGELTEKEKIITSVYSCKAGLGEKCTHI